MSAFIVSNETINKVVEGVLLGEGELITDVDKESMTLLGRALLELNQRAVGYRYQEEVDRRLTESYTYKPGTKMVSTGELVKSRACFLYQCTEGDFDETFHFMRVSGAIDVLKSSSSFALCDYESAAWG